MTGPIDWINEPWNNIPGKPTTPNGATNPEAAPDAYAGMVNILRQWGLGELAPEVLRLLQEGRSQEQVSLLLQDTEPYKRRFAGNEARRKAGLPVLSPGEYLQTETSYRRIMESNGLPPGFYDDPSDFASWIGSDVSPAEINTRVSFAVDAANRLDPGTRRAFEEFYGVQTPDLAAFFLDRERALPHIQKIARSARVGAAAFNQGSGFTREQAEQLGASTLVSDNELEQAVSQAVEVGRDTGKLGSLYGESFDVNTAAQEIFNADVEAKQRRQRLASRERAEFTGSSGLGKSSLARDTGRY